MKAEVLIIGGGLAGTAAAIEMARAGRDVLLLERDAAPIHKVCGEFLSVETLTSLQALGVSVEAFAAPHLHTVRLCGSGGCAKAPLPFPARSLTRRSLDAALLARAYACGARVQRGATVSALAGTTQSAWTATLQSGLPIHARHVFLATGKHDLRAHPRPAGKQRNLVAMKMYFRLSPAQQRALEGCVEVHRFPGGYGGLQPVEGDAANLCALIHRRELKRLGGWDGFLAHMCRHSPLLAERMHHAEPLLAAPLSISPIPYGFVRPTTKGEWYLGDQAAVIPSFTGDGMAIALHTGRVAASAFLTGSNAADFQSRIRKDVGHQVALATVLSRALVHPLAGPAALRIAQVFPLLLQHIAMQTRLRPAKNDRSKSPEKSVVSAS